METERIFSSERALTEQQQGAVQPGVEDLMVAALTARAQGQIASAEMLEAQLHEKMPNVDLKPIFAKLTAPGETIAALENAATSLKTMLEALRPMRNGQRLPAHRTRHRLAKPKRAPISNEPTDSEEDMLIFDEDVDDYDTEDENFIDEDEDEEVEEVDI